ncbi:hypothetical protein Hanom_Chr00s000001g01597011 [Helianthus anomalus]
MEALGRHHQYPLRAPARRKGIKTQLGLNLVKTTGAHAQASPHFKYASSSDAGGGVDPDLNQIQPYETQLKYYFHMYNNMRSQSIHSPLWNIRQGDVMTDPSLCREFFKGAFTPVEVERLGVLGRDYLYNQHALFLVGVAATCNVILRDLYALSQKEEEYNRFKSEATATMDNVLVKNQIRIM